MSENVSIIYAADAELGADEFGGVIAGGVMVNIRRVLIKSAWRALIPTALINIPVIGIAFLLLAYPVYTFFPELAHSSDAINYSFAAAFLTSAKAWLVFYLYYFLVLLSVSLCIQFVRFKLRS